MRARRSSTRTLAVVALAFLALLSTGTHTVRTGDTLAAIAREHGTSVAALAGVNQLENPDLIYVGQDLVIPSGGGPGAGGASTHEVRPGDTLGRIASRHGG